MTDVPQGLDSGGFQEHSRACQEYMLLTVAAKAVPEVDMEATQLAFGAVWMRNGQNWRRRLHTTRKM